MKKVISFSLWGSIKIYCIGVIKNALLANKIFPDWIVYIYYDITVPKIVIEYLGKMQNVELKFIDTPSGSKKWMEPGQFGMFWKFLPFDDNNVEIWMARDADSRISKYEKEKIDYFMQSENLIHSFIFNNKYKKLRGGTVSFKNFSQNKDNRDGINISKLINEYVVDKEKTPFYCDERFLNTVLYPKYANRYSCDTQCHNITKIIKEGMIVNSTSCHSLDVDYVGRVVDENDNLCHKDSNDWYKYNYDDLYDILDEFKNKLL